MNLSELNIDVALQELLGSNPSSSKGRTSGFEPENVSSILAEGIKPTYPEDHKPAMRVPKGGSSCASCEYYKGEMKCRQPDFIKWHGSENIPADSPDEYCSDWYEYIGKELEAGGPGSGCHGENCGRPAEGTDYTEHGVHVGIFDRPTEAGKDSIAVTDVFPNSPPPMQERKEIMTDFTNAAKRGQEDLPVSKLIPMQDTLEHSRIARLQQPDEDNFRATKLPSVFHYNGNYYLIDGHHRVAMDLEGGKKTLPINVFEPRTEVHAEDEDVKSIIAEKHDLFAAAIWHGIPIEGFSGPGEEMIRAAISRVPPELLANVYHVKAAPELQPKHGRYDPETHTVNINPLIFKLRQRFGEGQGWIYHTDLCMVHEIGHSIYYFFPEKIKDKWRDLSNWMVGTTEGQAPPYKETRPGWPHDISKWTHRKGIRFTRKYAQKNDDEDFADSFAFFILSKPHQMESSKREFIENLLNERVHAYPSVSVNGPDKPYGEREN